MLWYHSQLPMDKKDQKPKRQYPSLYEKGVPIAVGIIVLAIIVLLIISVAVIFGLFPGGG